MNSFQTHLLKLLYSVPAIRASQPWALECCRIAAAQSHATVLETHPPQASSKPINDSQTRSRYLRHRVESQGNRQSGQSGQKCPSRSSKPPLSNDPPFYTCRTPGFRCRNCWSWARGPYAFVRYEPLPFETCVNKSSTNLIRFGINVDVIDNRADKTATGRADGLQPKTLETLRQMRLIDRLLLKGVKVHDVRFWVWFPPIYSVLLANDLYLECDGGTASAPHSKRCIFSQRPNRHP